MTFSTDQFRLDNKVAIVTGAGGRGNSIGRAYALGLGKAGASVVVAAYDGRPRNPVLLAREHWPEVIAMATGDQGARAFLRARPGLVTLVECGDTGRPDDIDTPADLERVRDLRGPGSPRSG